jgi:hypothetical protein
VLHICGADVFGSTVSKHYRVDTTVPTVGRPYVASATAVDIRLSLDHIHDMFYISWRSEWRSVERDRTKPDVQAGQSRQIGHLDNAMPDGVSPRSTIKTVLAGA